MHVCSVVAGIHRRQRLGHALQAIGDRDQDVAHAAGLQVVEHLHPELGALGVLDPQAQDVARAVGQHAQAPGRSPCCAPPRLRGSSRAGRRRRSPGTSAPAAETARRRPRPCTASVTELMNSGVTSVRVLLGRKPWISRTVMPRAYMATILSSKPVKRRSCLGIKHRLERALPVARHLDAQRPVLGQHGLAAGAVAMVARRPRAWPRPAGSPGGATARRPGRARSAPS